MRLPLRHFLAVAVALVPAVAAAETKLTLVHQGYLLDDTDTPVNAESFTLGFSFWSNRDSTDTSFRVWPATPVTCTVRVSHGFYSVVLGTAECGPDLTTAHLPFGEVRHLEVAIESTPLTPRLRVAPVPAASVAGDALALEGRTLADLDERYAQPESAANALALEGQTLADLDARWAKLDGGGLSLLGDVAAAAFSGDGSGLTDVDAKTLQGQGPEAFAAAAHTHRKADEGLRCGDGQALVGFTSDGKFECAQVLPPNLPDADGDGTPDLSDGDADDDGLPNAIDPQPLFNPRGGTLVVRDGATSGADLRYQYTTLPNGALKANWDAVQGTTKYFVWIGTTPGGSDVLGGTDAGTATSVTTQPLALQGAWTGTRYFVSVAAMSAGGGVLATGTSNGLQIAEMASWNGATDSVGSSRVDLQACKLEYSIVSPK